MINHAERCQFCKTRHTNDESRRWYLFHEFSGRIEDEPGVISDPFHVYWCGTFRNTFGQQYSSISRGISIIDLENYIPVVFLEAFV